MKGRILCIRKETIFLYIGNGELSRLETLSVPRMNNKIRVRTQMMEPERERDVDKSEATLNLFLYKSKRRATVPSTLVEAVGRCDTVDDDLRQEI